jgi:glycosyltransferase involved in cell wall biosynthesis
LKPDDVAVVHNGVASPTASVESRPSFAGPLHVLTIARLVPWKRVELAIEALARVAAAEATLTIAGDGPGRTALQRLIAERGVQDRVALLGWRHDMDALFSSADALVHPSGDEWFGMAVLEATAHGVLPIVMADAGGALEVIPPDGVIAADVREIADTLRSLRGSPAVRDEARATRRAWAREHFSIERTVSGYAALYAKAMGTTRPTQRVSVAAE